MRMIKAQKMEYVNSLKKEIAAYKTVAIMPIDARAGQASPEDKEQA